MKQVTHKPCELTDILDDRTYQATYLWCGIDSQGVSSTYKDTREPSSHSRYQDDCSPDSVWIDGNKIGNDEIEYEGYCQKKETKEEHSPECSEMSVSESASVKGDDNILAVEVLSGVDNLEVPRLPGYNDKHRKLNGGGLIAVKQETHKPCESTDILDDRTY